jgi:hypothetical protein
MIPIWLASLAVSVSAAAPLPSVELTGFPFVRQKPDFCGEADVEMALGRLGHVITQDEVFGLSGVDPLLGRGAWTHELAKSLRALGIEPGPVWNRIDPKKAAAQIDAQWRALHADLIAGQPSIVCMHSSDQPQTTEHFRLVTGYDAKTDEVIYQEPAEDDGANRRMARPLFVKLWTFKPAADRWTMIRLQLPAPATAPKPAPEASPTRAEVAQHVIALADTLPKEMTLVWEKPFLVIGNEGAAQVKERSKSLVRWTRDLLLKDFFAEPPRTLQEVWILKDKPTYEKYSRALFKTEPSTPYGYYLSGRRALVMNIKPGYGTLTHELVHPFMHHAWNDAEPGWLNEGLASLFERPAEREGHLVGKVNWRLPQLLEGLKEKRVPSFKQLVHLSSNDFYEDPSGTHYAAARYLCYWLQEKGLLAKLVRRATALKDQDPTGWQALTEVLGGDPDARRPEWEKFVKGLSTRA